MIKTLVMARLCAYSAFSKHRHLSNVFLSYPSQGFARSLKHTDHQGRQSSERSESGKPSDRQVSREEQDHTAGKKQGRNLQPKVLKSGAFEILDPKKSKYGLEREIKNEETRVKRKDAPAYLKNEETFQEFTAKDFNERNPADVKAEQKALRELERPAREQKPSKETTSIAAKVEKSEKERRMQ